VQHPKGFTGVPQIDGCAGYSATPIELFELDLAIDNQLQAGLTQGQCDLDRQLLLAGQAAFESASRTVFSTSRCAVIPNSLAHALDRDAPAGVGRVARGGLSRDGIGRGIAAENFIAQTDRKRPTELLRSKIRNRATERHAEYAAGDGSENRQRVYPPVTALTRRIARREPINSGKMTTVLSSAPMPRRPLRIAYADAPP
jgi:hypothetical protein